MKVYYNLSDIPHIKNPVVTIGNFDGVHAGHLHILESLLEQEKSGYESVVITFWPHPRKILNPVSEEMKFLTSIEEKIILIEKAGIKNLIVLNFTKELAEKSASEFTDEILWSKLKAKKIVLGYDHRFGKDRIGGLDHLKSNNEKYQFILEEIPRKDIDDIAISSSRIRESLLNGNLEIAKSLLCRPYVLSGIVTEGDKIGRTIGFPTANLTLLFPDKLIPKKGVYAVKVNVLQQAYKGVMNIGFRPTVGGSTLRLEINIFDFSQDIYGKELSVELLHFIREEQKFESLNLLKEQIEFDKWKAKEILDNISWQ